ncbi:MAG: DeoR/GlpR family DNA-binding transcription regulator [Spirochaetaceae bacterium]
MNDRHKEILNIISDGRKATVNHLAEKLNVSQATIRQDLTLLENKGFLKRVHGGAVLDETDDISHRMGINYEEKLLIAKAAVNFVNEGETIYIESGSINALLAQEIVKERKTTTIITSNAFIARQIGKESEGRVILLGGIYQPESECLVGTLVRECLNKLNFSKAFIGVDGFSETTGFTGKDMMRAEINSYIIQKSPQTFILTDSSKFGKITLSKYCDASDIEYLITDNEIPNDYHKLIKNSGVEIIIPEKE